MRYNPKDASQAWPAGDYEATIKSVEAKTSKSGNEMEVVTLTVYHPEGKEQTVWDYIVNPATVFKIKKIAKALGFSAEFEAGTFQVSDCVGANMLLTLDVEEDAEYGDKNKIKNYQPSRVKARREVAAAVASTGKAATPLVADDIPF